MMNDQSTSFNEDQMLHLGTMTLKLTRIARLKLFAQQRRLEGPGELGNAIGRKANQTSDLLNGRASFGEKVARSIEDFAQLPTGWLDQTDANSSTDLAVANENTLQPKTDAIDIPILGVEGSMGDGSEQVDEVVVSTLALTAQWLDKNIRPVTALSNLRFIHGYGDSMKPTFSNGDLLLVDGGIREILIDGIYVLNAHGRLFIKRVRQRMDGKFEISSDNPTVKTVDVLDGTHSVLILGRVVWAWNGIKL